MGNNKYIIGLIVVLLIMVNCSKNDLKISIKTEKNTYKINEPIFFTITSNKDAFIYIFNRTDEQNILLYPNQYQKNNKILAGNELKIPSKEYSFLSKNVGVEKIVVIASRKDLKINLGNFSARGGFYTAKKTRVEGIIKRSKNNENKEAAIIKKIDIEIKK